jgi:enoyl-CoA hydratase
MTYWEIEQKDSVLVVSYNNPPMNYLCGAAFQEFEDVLMPACENPSVRAIVLQGKPKGLFMTHFSVEELLAMSDGGFLKGADASVMTSGHRRWAAFERLSKPVVAALTGSAMGGGYEQSLACDIRIAESGDYRIGLPEANLGILPGGTGLTRLTRLIGASNAINIILRGLVFKPDEALKLGMVHEVVKDARARALEIAQSLATKSPTAMAVIKKAVYEGAEKSFDEALLLEGQGFIDCMNSDEAISAMKDYVAIPFEKRQAWLDEKAKAI